MWKNATFLVGFAWLVWGSYALDYPDWTVGVSVVMAGSTYLTADWVIRVIKARRYVLWPLAALFAWWCVDGSYWAYWSFLNPSVMIREGQWAMSLCLYLLCGIIWTADPRPTLRYLGLLRAAPAQLG
jgi:hypothetical protein